MDKKLFSTGVVLLLVGIFLLLAFWPLTAVNADDLATDREENSFEDYSEGDVETVYGTITDIHELGNLVFIELNGDFSVVLDDEDGVDFSESDVVYGDIILRQDEIMGHSFPKYWELDNEFKSKRNIDYLFYGVIGVGMAVAAAGVTKV